MAHKYLDEIGYSGSKICLYNTEEREDPKESDRQERWDKEREEYGFDNRETWALDFTAATWLHDHLKMYIELGGEIVNLSFHTFTIPVLKEDDVTEEPSGISEYAVENKELTQEEAIKLCIRYLERYILYEKEDVSGLSVQEINKRDFLAMQMGQQAFRIFAEIMPAMWW